METNANVICQNPRNIANVSKKQYFFFFLREKNSLKTHSLHFPFGSSFCLYVQSYMLHYFQLGLNLRMVVRYMKISTNGRNV